MRQPPNHFGAPHGGRRGGRRSGPERSLAEISVTVWLTEENASFRLRNGLLYLTLDGTEKRVTLFRQFPFDLLWEYISVLDEDEHELGIIKNLDLFSQETRGLLEDELKKRYYTVEIKAILSIKEKLGFSYWKVKTSDGDLQFTLKDTTRSIGTVNGTRLFFTDISGNRYEIPDLNMLDVKSRRFLELYV